MPNGGSDNCGLCWFNAKNKGQAGIAHLDEPEPDFCLIRGLPVMYSALYTYCANHPHHNPGKLSLPVGPAFIADENDRRVVWVPSPDTEPIRLQLLSILAEMKEEPIFDYPAGWSLDEAAMWQVGEFGEQRAVADLERIASFNPNVHSPEGGRTRARTVWLAKQALEKIQQGEQPEPGVESP